MFFYFDLLICIQSTSVTGCLKFFHLSDFGLLRSLPFSRTFFGQMFRTVMTVVTRVTFNDITTHRTLGTIERNDQNEKYHEKQNWNIALLHRIVVWVGGWADGIIATWVVYVLRAPFRHAKFKELNFNGMHNHVKSFLFGFHFSHLVLFVSL